jgi:hypothetical protein
MMRAMRRSEGKEELQWGREEKEVTESSRMEEMKIEVHR